VDTIFVAVNEAYLFPKSYVGDVIHFSCVYGQTDEAKKLNKSTHLMRGCVSTKENTVEWDQVDLTSCSRNTNTIQLRDLNLVGQNGKFFILCTHPIKSDHFENFPICQLLGDFSKISANTEDKIQYYYHGKKVVIFKSIIFLL